MERILLGKALAYAQVEKTEILNIEYMSISTKEAFEVLSANYSKPIEFYANVVFLD